MKVKDLIKRIRKVLVEPSGAFWSDNTLFELIEKAELACAIEIKPFEDSSYLDLVRGIKSYTLPDNFIVANNVFINNKLSNNKDNWIKLENTDITHISRDYTNFLDENEELFALPKTYFIWGNEIFLYPIPDKNYRLFMLYKSKPRKLTSLEDDLNVDDTLIDLVESYVLWKAWAMEKEMDLANDAYDQYQSWILKLRKLTKKRQVSKKQLN